MKLNLKRLIVFALATTLLFATGCSGDKTKTEKVFKYVYDLGTYTSLNDQKADQYFDKEYNNWGGGCTAVAKKLDNKDLIVGRNMDLNISNKLAYIHKTKLKDCYETIGLTYTFRDISPDLDDFKKNGLSKEFRNLIPHMADDMLNSEGLYVEINMREKETMEDGSDKFSNSGTNVSSDHKVYIFELPYYISLHCATVKEAVDYVKTLNVYSKKGYWNYAFMIADAKGNYGVLEIANNKVYWKDKQNCQTNFYVNKNLNKIQQNKVGVGRYDLAVKDVKKVKNEADMMKLMKTLNYSNFYKPDTCKFDIRPECVEDGVPYDYVMQPKIKSMIYDKVRQEGQAIEKMSRQELQDANKYWESTFTEVVNCNEKTIRVRFFEDKKQEVTLKF